MRDKFKSTQPMDVLIFFPLLPCGCNLFELQRGYLIHVLMSILLTKFTIIVTNPGMPWQSNGYLTSIINYENKKFSNPISESICKDNLFDDFNIEEGLLGPHSNTWINKDKKTLDKSSNYKTYLLENKKSYCRTF